MKIEFIKEYCACFRDENGSINTETFEHGDTVSTSMEADRYFTEELAQWLIKNGFAEEVKESGWWKPKLDQMYYFLDGYSKACVQPWLNDEFDDIRYSMGNVFKTKEAADRYRDYLKAIATVRQGEGVLTPDDVRKTLARDGTVYTIGISCTMLSVERTSAGAVYFDTGYNAKTSLNEHQDEWKIIANYDWSRE